MVERPFFRGRYPSRRLLIALLLAVPALISLLLVVFVDFGNPPDFFVFVGRFHPMVVHFPIGFLVLGGLLEVVSRCFPDLKVSGSTIILVLGLSAITAVIAAAAGFFLSLTGGYSEDLVAWHKWLGIAVAVGAVGAVVLRIQMARGREGLWRRAYQGILLGTVAVLLTTGHLGGTLTHGSGYLTQYLPQPVKALTGLGGAAPADRTIAFVDSAIVFTHLVQPVLNDRCVSCHNESKTKGELRLDAPEHIMEGGEDGKIIVPGNPEESEIVRRTTLPLYHDDRMPPEGEEPLSVEETELIRWWVATGASFDTTVAEVRTDETPSAIQTVLARLSRPRAERQTGIYALEAPSPDSSAIERLVDEGFAIQRIAQDAPFLEVKLSDSGQAVDQERLAGLEPIASQIAWLDLSGSTIDQDALASVAEMEHLTRLHLQRSTAADEELRHLNGLDHLKYLNLYGTDVTDAGLNYLRELEDLETLYLWQTDVTPQGVKAFQQQRTAVTINRGAPVVSADSTRTAVDSTAQAGT